MTPESEVRAEPTRQETAAGSIVRAVSKARAFFRDRDPIIAKAFVPAFVVSALLFTRSPLSNYIFDEQEALLANPFVNGKVAWHDILTRDFWGLPHDRSIGSYRPLPNVIWRAFWEIHPVFRQPWALHWVNIVVHALNAACVARIAFGLTGRRQASWLAGLSFATFAILTEAVTGVVGIADVLGALGLLLSVLALEKPLPTSALLVFAGTTLGLFSKESTLVALPIVSWVALVSAPLYHPKRPLRGVRALVALVASAAALVLYTQTRRHFFPTELPAELTAPLPSSASLVHRWFFAFLRWFAQPRLPQDPINNPLVDADFAHRVSGALGVYAGGIGQLLLPLRLSGDYSFAAEPVPEKLYNLRSVLGGLLLVLPGLAGALAWISAVVSERRGRLEGARSRMAVAIALVWAPVAYFPHSNIPVVLPTVRAERFWYLPAAGVALGISVFLGWLLAEERLPRVRRAGIAIAILFVGHQSLRARIHALDYMNDLSFWRATARSVPKSAKAHLNYGVMLGARGQLGERLVENRAAMVLAPSWPMAHVYYADTLCRLGRAEEAWPEYEKGFSLGPNDRNLVALALQCLWDKGAIAPHKTRLLDMSEEHPGTWLAYLAHDIVSHGEANGGVERKYRPRGYDEGPSE